MSDEMKKCPYCAEQILADAVKCRYCGSFLHMSSPFHDEWYRLVEGKMLAGVCGGLAHHFNISVTLVRVGFILASLVPGMGVGILLYIVLWIIMPKRRLSEIMPPPGGNRN